MPPMARKQACADANKRTGWFSTVPFLRVHGFRVTATQTEAVEFSKANGRGEHPDSC